MVRLTERPDIAMAVYRGRKASAHTNTLISRLDISTGSMKNKRLCTKIHRNPIFSTRYSVMRAVYTGYHGTSETELGLYSCTVDNPLAKARGLSLRTGAQTMLYLSHNLVFFGPAKNILWSEKSYRKARVLSIT